MKFVDLSLWVDHKLHKAAQSSMEPKGRIWLHGPRGGKKAAGEKIKREKWRVARCVREPATALPKQTWNFTSAVDKVFHASCGLPLWVDHKM